MGLSGARKLEKNERENVLSDTEELLEATTALILPLLHGLDALGQAGRFMHPPELAEVCAAIAQYREPLEAGRQTFARAQWPEHLEAFTLHANMATTLALRAFDGFAGAVTQPEPPIAAYRAMGLAAQAFAAAYPLAAMLPPVNRFYLEPEVRDNAELQQKLLESDPEKPDVGVMHADNAADQRGGFSVYVPEYYQGEPLPLVMALHGGSGHGRQFLWSWLRAVRSDPCILIAPTSADRTWSLMNSEADSQRLHDLVAYAQQHWNVDSQRMLLTGMSDGGTFSYVSGLQSSSPFTHLAPCSASFHPMLLEEVDSARLQGLPIYLMHGVLDWMFPVSVAQEADAALRGAGARVNYREIENLSHTYPQEENSAILRWLADGD